ncbi:hypothetical protein HUO13_26155 [Saccharopolyspora erythraea]|uniref:hypothetical protein n=1 Tax=Saccharopolyspora erythraea TaxID=1836 RepID=UPI001BA61F08|nr:hypothetical protein [Saccharopolyspora erythraea]QUH03835.1 hypothetical protein HUO13_26155 [Saccharopolyspora erythraea]
MPDLSITTVDDSLNAAQEPTPGDKPRKRGRPRGSTNKQKQQAFARELGEELDAMLKMIAMLWSTRDPVCGGALNETSSLIANDIAELAASSARARKYLEQTMGLGKIVPLLMHLTPLIMTIREHHLSPKNSDDESAETHGRAYPVG